MSQPIINFEFDSINLVCDWNYNCINTECEICKKSIYEEPPIKGDKVRNTVNTHIVKGECSHAFHRNCIKTHIKKNITCPACPEGTQYKFKQSLEDISSIRLFRN